MAHRTLPVTFPTRSPSPLWRGRTLHLCVLFVGFLLLESCQSSPWKLMRTINPYTQKQPANLYDYSLRVSGVQLHIRKFYTTKTLACADMEANNKKGYGAAYIDPRRVQFVCGKIGTWALTSTSAARDPMFKKMATDAYKLSRPEQLRRWSQHYFPRGTVPLRQSRRGLICFQLRRRPDDPEALVTTGRCRLRLRDIRIANGAVRAGWIFVEAL